MTDKKITDEEIKSSLEVIATTRNCNECKIRNCKWGTCNCSQITANAALDLINRQKAKIEKLKGSTIVSNIMESQRIKREAKAEAYKEFAEKAKENFQNLEYSADTDRKTVKVEEMKEQINWVLHSVAAETLDNILEELVGENNERNIV